VVIFLHEDVIEEASRLIPTGEVQFIVAKNRQGPLGVRTVSKYGHYGKLAEEHPANVRRIGGAA
jgi:replicative DNA helicase